MNSIIDIVLPVFGLGALGYVASRLNYFPDKAIDGLSRFVFDIAVPAMLLRIFSGARLPEDVPWNLMISFYFPIMGIYLAGIAAALLAMRQNFMAAVLTGLGCAFGNMVLLGLPLVLRSLGEAAAVPFSIVLSVHGVSFYAITTVLMELGRNHGGALRQVALSIARELATNPFIIAIVAGIVLNFSNTPLPVPVDHLAEYLQQAVTPCALFTLGASLTRYHVAGQWRESLFIVAMKNLVFPLCVWMMAGQWLGLKPLWVMVVVLMAAQPSGVTFFIFAERYAINRGLAATTIFLSSVLSILTIPLVLYLFTTLGYGIGNN